MTDQLRSIYARWQNLEADKAAISEDLKELFAEAKGNGYDAKALRIAFRLKAMSEGPDASAVAETASIIELYLAGLNGKEITLPSRERTRVPRERLPKSAYQEPRLAPLGEMKDALKAGNPISGDERHWEGRVYVARCFALGLIKIGVSNDVDARVVHLSKEIGNPVTLVSHFDGCRQDEMRLQEALVTWRHSGEWFRDTPDCQSALATWIRENVHDAPRAHPRVTRKKAPEVETVASEVPRAREPVAAVATPARGNPSNDDWPDLPAFLDRRGKGA